MNFGDWQNVVIFDRGYTKEEQAEGIAVNRAVIGGHCDACGFLKTCSTSEDFKPPVFAWCFQEKKRIIASWEAEQK